MDEQQEANARYRESAHVLLDAVTAFDHEAGDVPGSSAPVELALRRLQDVEGITILRDDETDEISVDARPVLGATMHMLTLLIHYAAEQSNADPLAVVATVRAQMDKIYGA